MARRCLAAEACSILCPLHVQIKHCFWLLTSACMSAICQGLAARILPVRALFARILLRTFSTMVASAEPLTCPVKSGNERSGMKGQEMRSGNDEWESKEGVGFLRHVLGSIHSARHRKQASLQAASRTLWSCFLSFTHRPYTG